MTLLAAWQLLLARYAGQEDVVVGTPVAGRTRLETEPLIGFFVNTLVLRTDLSGEPSFRDLLGRVRETTLGAYQHQEIPFERLVEELAPQRSLAYSPLFQVMFALQNNEQGELRMDDLEVEPLAAGGREIVKFDLTLAMIEDGQRFAGSLSYRAGLWDEPTVARQLDHFGYLLEQVAAAPERKVSGVSLLRGAERAQVLEAWNETVCPYPGARCVHDQFAEQAALTPGAVAVVGRGQALTYAGLDRRAGRLARVLHREGVGQEQVVGIFMEHSADVVVAVLGTLRAGGCCLLLDPEHPPARISSLLADAGVELVVMQPHLRGQLPSREALRVVELAGEGEADGEELPILPRVAPESAAYLVYTSGSTGRPKGVLVPHAAAATHFREIGRTYGLSPADRVLVFASQGFDPFLEQVLAPLLAGASVALRDPAVWTPAEFAERVASLEVTVANVPPAYWGQLVHERAVVAALRQTLRLVIVGGEALAPWSVRAWEDGGQGGTRLLNAYGPTEAVVTATVHEASGGAGGAWGASVPIGRAVGGRRAYVLDPRGEPVPMGVPGELYLGGAVLARGYLARPEQTASRFVPDGFGDVAGGRLYRTGDRVRWLGTGRLEFLGRLDAQVKVRGFRIEPGEIEAVLEENPRIRKAVVLAREDAPGYQRLVAYVVPAEGAEVVGAELRAFLRERLPEHMVPGAWVTLDSIPLTANGKLDRRALPAPEAVSATTYVAPRTPAEEVLGGIWAEVLGVERVGVEDDFFDLGGHSLLAVRLLAVVEARTGRRLSLPAFFAHPTIAHLAAALRLAQGEGGTGPLVPIRAAGRKRPLFFVHGAGGAVRTYAVLAGHLGPDRPFYGLQSRGLDGEAAPLASLVEMAADYCHAVRSVQSEGPYLLGGWSMGGAVALEMARQLEAAGQRVERLVLVDTVVPGSQLAGSDGDAALLVSFARHLEIPLERIAVSQEEILALAPGERLQRAWEAARDAQVVPPELDLTHFRPLWDVFLANAQASRDFSAGTCAADLLLVRAAERATRAPEEVEGWAALTTGRMDVRIVPGDHFSMMREPYVGVLAAVLFDFLD